MPKVFSEPSNDPWLRLYNGCSIFKGLLDSKINDYFWQHTPILDQAYTFGTLARASSTFSLGYS
ncbi:MAG: hypothetical protein DDT28_00128 [Dehalococcoidia bacterium]|nr:hypothetical protein [Chloroflexota bacterium]